jgi:hypothetical protein
LGFADTICRSDEVLAFLSERSDPKPAQPPRVVVV